MAAGEDVGGGRAGADPDAGAEATNPGGGSGTPPPSAPTQTLLTAVLGSPAFPHHHYQFYARSPLGQPPARPLQFPAPSPYQTNYLATPTSARWSSSKSMVARYSNNVLRTLATAFSFLTVTLIPASATARDRTLAGTKPDGSSSLLDYSPFSFLFGVGIIAGVYSAAQLSKGIWEISFNCNLLLSGNAVHYGTFILDMVLSYLLLSSSSDAVLGLQLRDKSPIHARVGTSAWSLAGSSIATSFTAFIVVATSAVLSGYKLCKSIIR